jgi:hypothetical protein
MSYDKVLLAYKDDEGNYHSEAVRAIKEGQYYRIKSIPVYTENIAFNDLVAAELKGNILFFDKLIEISGHSVVQMIIFDEKMVQAVGKALTKRGLSWVLGEQKDMIAIDIPKERSYAPIKKWLVKVWKKIVGIIKKPA